MTPIVGGTMLWTGSILVVGTVTMVVGAARALLETDLKRVLAYSTISALGILMLLFAIGTPAAVTAGLAYLLAHACYKGALFLVAGAVEHETGVRDVARLGGLRRAMPATALGAGLAAASMAGVPFFGGFVAKEQLYDTIRLAAFPGRWPDVLTTAVVAVSMCLGAAGLIAGIAPFRGPSLPTPAPRDAPLALWLGPLILGVAGVIFGLFPSLASTPIALAATAVTGTTAGTTLALWHVADHGGGGTRHRAGGGAQWRSDMERDAGRRTSAAHHRTGLIVNSMGQGSRRSSIPGDFDFV